MGYHWTIRDADTGGSETIYHSSFTPRRHAEAFGVDPLDCFVYFEDGEAMIGERGVEHKDGADLGEWEPDWPECLEAALRLQHAVDIAHDDNPRNEKDSALCTALVAACRAGAEHPGRFVVSVGY